MAIFTPLINMAGYEHCLNAMPTFVHQNGTVYGISIEKRGGVTQNLSVYRMRSGSTNVELVHRYLGGQDSAAQIAAGGCLIDTTGALRVWASAVPMGVPPITKTGFVGGYWPAIPDVDEPWGGSSGGGIKLLPAVATNPAWEARSLTSGVMVDIPSTFGVPSASAYLVRVTMNAPLPNVRARFGTQACPFFYTVNSRSNGEDEMDQGWVPGPQCYVSPAQGTPTTWLQIVGYSA